MEVCGLASCALNLGASGHQQASPARDSLHTGERRHLVGRLLAILVDADLERGKLETIDGHLVDGDVLLVVPEVAGDDCLRATGTPEQLEIRRWRGRDHEDPLALER